MVPWLGLSRGKAPVNVLAQNFARTRVFLPRGSDRLGPAQIRRDFSDLKPSRARLSLPLLLSVQPHLRRPPQARRSLLASRFLTAILSFPPLDGPAGTTASRTVQAGPAGGGSVVPRWAARAGAPESRGQTLSRAALAAFVCTFWLLGAPEVVSPGPPFHRTDGEG